MTRATSPTARAFQAASAMAGRWRMPNASRAIAKGWVAMGINIANFFYKIFAVNTSGGIRAFLGFSFPVGPNGNSLHADMSLKKSRKVFELRCLITNSGFEACVDRLY